MSSGKVPLQCRVSIFAAHADRRAQRRILGADAIVEPVVVTDGPAIESTVGEQFTIGAERDVANLIAEVTDRSVILAGKRIDQLQAADRVHVQQHIVKRVLNNRFIIKQQRNLGVTGGAAARTADAVLRDPLDRINRLQPQQRIGTAWIKELIQRQGDARLVGNRHEVRALTQFGSTNVGILAAGTARG